MREANKTAMIVPGQRIAFQMSQCLGDSLLAMIVVNNLIRNGYRVSVFGDYIAELKNWFPGCDISPSVRPEQARALFAPFDVVLHAYPRNIVGDTRAWHPRCWVLDEWPCFRQVKNMVGIHLDVCEIDLKLQDPTKDNGCVPPAHLQRHAHPDRVAIHPSASVERKIWPRSRFLTLTKRLQMKGYTPEFIVAPNERPDWRDVEERGFSVRSFSSLSDAAGWIYESGHFIGNDSGLAHLASNIGTPAVSLMVRRKVATRWTPGWTQSRGVLPLPILPGKMAKDRLWKYCLSPGRVLKAFDELLGACSAEAAPHRPLHRLRETPRHLLGDTT